jgi:hypothetical protein
LPCVVAEKKIPRDKRVLKNPKFTKSNAKCNTADGKNKREKKSFI